jgi:1-deoxyxylulose-5-phosphate synthase
VLDEAAAEPFVRAAADAGITFFDTADVYSLGVSEEITGRLLKTGVSSPRGLRPGDQGAWPMGDGPNDVGLSRAHIMDAVDASLRRLDVDHIDLYQIHRWDDDTPIEETMQALHDCVRAGKVRYLGASSMHAWQFAKAQRVAALEGLTPFVSMQNHYNLLYREEEREMLPQCADMGVGVIPWSPLARGRLARPADEATATDRAKDDDFGDQLYRDASTAIIDEVGRIADERGVSRAQVALAWMLSKDVITAPIIGATKPSHVQDAAAATTLELTDDEVAALEAPYRPRPVLGHA